MRINIARKHSNFRKNWKNVTINSSVSGFFCWPFSLTKAFVNAHGIKQVLSYFGVNVIDMILILCHYFTLRSYSKKVQTSNTTLTKQ